MLTFAISQRIYRGMTGKALAQFLGKRQNRTAVASGRDSLTPMDY
jgi:hypothetical protein